MSVRTMARVWELSRNRGNDLLMLLAIADFADDDGNAYPSVPTLAEKCRMKARNANLILAALRKTGELEVRQNEGPHGTNRYCIVLPAEPLQESTEVQKRTGMQILTRTPVETYPKPLQKSTDEPSVNHQEPLLAHNAKKPRRAAMGFDAKSHLLSLSVPDQVASDWLSLRKAKRAAPTKTAIEGIQREAENAGISLGNALAISCERGWQGFRADWLNNQRGQTLAKPKAPKPGDRRTRHGADEVFTEGCGWVPA